MLFLCATNMQQASCDPESPRPSSTPKERASSVYSSLSSRSRIEEEEEEDLAMAREMYKVETAEAVAKRKRKNLEMEMYEVEIEEAAAKLERRTAEARQRRTMRMRESESPFQGDKSPTQSTSIPPGAFKPIAHLPHTPPQLASGDLHTLQPVTHHTTQEAGGVISSAASAAAATVADGTQNKVGSFCTIDRVSCNENQNYVQSMAHQHRDSYYPVNQSSLPPQSVPHNTHCVNKSSLSSPPCPQTPVTPVHSFDNWRAQQRDSHAVPQPTRTDDPFSMQQLINALQAPKVTIPKFSGSALEYHSFITAFDNNVHNRLSDPTARLAHLMQQCTGKALAVLQGVACLEPAHGYETARRLLQDRFGSPVRVAQAWVAHILSQDKVRQDDPSALQSYADLLRTGYHTLQAIDALPEVSAQQTLTEVILKLPEHLHYRWRREVVRIHKSMGRLGTFKDLVEFVELAAEEANLPVFRPGSKSSGGAVKEKKVAGSFHIVTSPQRAGCLVCGSDHRLWHCVRFKQMSVVARQDLVKQKHLCLNCMGSGHGVRECRSKFSCKICGKKHHTMLHGESNSSPAHSAGHQGGSSVGGATSATTGSVASPDDTVSAPSHPGTVASEEQTGFNGLVYGTFQRVALPIVAVKVRAPGQQAEVSTYALLDNGSTSTFCDSSIPRALGLIGTEVAMTLSTLQKKEQREVMEAFSLEVSDASGSNSHLLPMVLSRSSLPISKDSIPHWEDVSKYPHLSDLALPVPDISEVTLIIGLDNAECLMPSNVIRGPSGQPFAVQTILGWSIHGPMSTTKCQSDAATFYPKCQSDAATFYPKCQSDAATFYPKCQSGAATFFVQADSGSENPQVEPLSLREQFDERHLQQADKQVLNMWQDATTLEQGHSCMATPFQADKPQQLYCLPSATPLGQCLGRMFEEEDPSTGIEAKRGPESTNGLTPDAKPSVQWNMAYDHSNKSLHYTVGQLDCEKGR